MEAKNNTTDKATFRYRAYGKGELASLYMPDIMQQSAVTRFNEWIAAFPGLKERLEATGLNHLCRRYTPAQVRMIVEALGEP